MIMEMKPSKEQREVTEYPARLLEKFEKTKSTFVRLQEMTSEAFSGIMNPPEDLFRHKYLNEHVFVKEVGSAVVGYALVEDRALGSYLTSIVVDPAYRGRGLGHQLLEAVIAQARKEKKNRISLTTHVDNPAQKVYYDCGFRMEEIIPQFYGAEGAGLRMGLKLEEKNHVQ